MATLAIITAMDSEFEAVRKLYAFDENVYHISNIFASG